MERIHAGFTHQPELLWPRLVLRWRASLLLSPQSRDRKLRFARREGHNRPSLSGKFPSIEHLLDSRRKNAFHVVRISTGLTCRRYLGDQGGYGNRQTFGSGSAYHAVVHLRQRAAR